MFEQIQLAETVQSRRRVYFALIDATSHTAGKDITTTGVKMYLSKNGATPALSTNDIAKISGANMPGEYYLDLTAAEVDTTGQLIFYLSASGADPVDGQATVVPFDPYADGASLTATADAILARNQQGGSNAGPTVSQALAGGLLEFTISGSTLTIKNGDGTTAFTRTLTGSSSLSAAV